LTDFKIISQKPIAKQNFVVLDGFLSAGDHAVRFEATDLPGGLYLYRLQAEKFTASGKAVLMK